MNSSNEELISTIEARLVPEAERLETLPKHFGRYLSAVENLVYVFARRLVPSYGGGYWHFYELSNGGFYMAPQMKPALVSVDGNGFSGEMSADAIGVTICLFAFSHGSFQYPDETFARHYELLREFSYSHSEGRSISAAID